MSQPDDAAWIAAAGAARPDDPFADDRFAPTAVTVFTQDDHVEPTPGDLPAGADGAQIDAADGHAAGDPAVESRPSVQHDTTGSTDSDNPTPTLGANPAPAPAPATPASTEPRNN